MRPADVAAIVKAGRPGKYAVGGMGGLALVVRPDSDPVWVLRTRVLVDGESRSTDRRLGVYAGVVGKKGGLTLVQARKEAEKMRVAVASGADPVTERRRERAAAKAAAGAQAATFEAIARATYETVSAGFKNGKHAAQWIGTLEEYVFPALGDRPVDTIGVPDVAEVLKPIWLKKPETARRVRQRMDRVFRYAMAHGATTTNPVPAVDDLLPEQKDQVAHHPALPVAEMSRFMSALRAAEGNGARALEFAILTAARSREVRGARWREMNIKARLWTVPGERMKRGREHVVPLSDAALALLKSLQKGEAVDLIFPSVQPNRERCEMSDMALLAVVHRLHEADLAAGGKGFLDVNQLRDDGEHPIATPHGTARSTFRDWCSQNGVPREIAERALAHAVGDRTEEAYARSTLIEQRRPVMQAWGAFCTSASLR